MIEPPVFARTISALVAVALLSGSRRPRPLPGPLVSPLGRAAILPLLVVAVAIVHPPTRLIARRSWLKSTIVRALLAPRLEGSITAAITALKWALILLAGLKPRRIPARFPPIGSLNTLIVGPASGMARLLALRAGTRPSLEALRVSRKSRPVVALEAAVILAVRPTFGKPALILWLTWIKIALRAKATLAAFVLRLPVAARWRSGPPIAIGVMRLAGSPLARRHLSTLRWSRAARSGLRTFALNRNLGIAAAGGILFRQVHMNRFEERLRLAH